MLRSLALPLAVAAALTTAACGDNSFHVQRTPEFPKTAGASLALFGVFRDGRLAPEAWDAFRSHTSPVFGVTACEPGYPDILAASGTPTLQAVDDYARANGVTDELLDRLAAASKGDLLLLITMTGRPSSKADSDKDSSTPIQTSVPGMRGGGRGGRGAQGSAPPKKAAGDANAFEIVGVVFSAKAHKSVGAIRLTYTGTSVDEALQSFMTRVGEEIPQATCGAWRSDLHLEPGDIRKLDTD